MAGTQVALWMNKSIMLSVTSQYALRALVMLVKTFERDHILGRDLAKQTRVPSNYLSKILLSLGHAGIVEATRGTGGGYRLGKPPRDIRLIEVVGLFEGPKSESFCLLGDTLQCLVRNPCTAHQAWGEIYKVYLNFLESTSLADIAPGPAGSSGQEPGQVFHPTHEEMMQ